jgi:ABC-type antimicrobial peptide transport system permease subunit
VENTYLSTFQVLGGFGLLLGAGGLAVVMLRSVWERRGELALLRSLGFAPRDLAQMANAENLALLLMGLCAGVLAAVVSLIPSIALGESSGVAYVRTSAMVLAALATGWTAGTIAAAATRRAPEVAALRGE